MSIPARVALVAGVLLAGAAVLALASLAATAPLTDDQSPAAPCPATPRRAQPSAFHFEPGLEQHRSWIVFNVPEPDATAFVLCLDGQAMAHNVGETPQHGQVTVSVTTRWVDAQWLLHQLDSYRAPERWELRYTPYSLQR